MEHPFDPVYNKQSRILILGSFPSVKSREGDFYYDHPQNRFWKVISGICEVELPVTIEEKKKMLINHGIAVWDVIKSCEITGSSDSSIKNVITNDISRLLQEADIKKIIANGGVAFKLYMKHIYPSTKIKCIKMPSTSPANASYSLDKLIKCWSESIKNNESKVNYK